MFCAVGIACAINLFQGEAQHSLVVLNRALVPDIGQQMPQVAIAGELISRPWSHSILRTNASPHELDANQGSGRTLVPF